MLICSLQTFSVPILLPFHLNEKEKERKREVLSHLQTSSFFLSQNPSNSICPFRTSWLVPPMMLAERKGCGEYRYLLAAYVQTIWVGSTLVTHWKHRVIIPRFLIALFKTKQVGSTQRYLVTSCYTIQSSVSIVLDFIGRY